MRWSTWAGIGLGIVAGSMLLQRGADNSRRLTLNHETIPIPDLPEAFDQFRLLQLSDLHLRRYSQMGDELLAMVAAINPDLVCLTGDYLYTALSLPELEDFFYGLSQYPTVGVFGNADYRPGITKTVREEWSKYFPFLKNNALCLDRDGDDLWIVGVDDPHHRRDDLTTAMAPVPDDAPAILLAHSPEIIQRPLDPRIRLILTGHTHGGQICLPGGKALYTNIDLPREFSAGRHQLGNAVLYISRGVGSTRLPLRYKCLPEITLFTLVRGEA